MSLPELPAGVARFVADNLDSLEQLELLLLLMQAPDRWWDAGAVANMLGLRENDARRALDALAKRNLLAIRITGDVRYQFSPGTPALAEAAAAFAAAYREHRLATLRLLTGRSFRSLRDFADAFRIRRDDDDR